MKCQTGSEGGGGKKTLQKVISVEYFPVCSVFKVVVFFCRKGPTIWNSISKV